MKGRAIEWQPEELAWIEAKKGMPRAEAHAMFCARFMRDDVSLKAYNGLCKRKGWLTGRTGCFAKGHATHNKGKPMGAETRAKCLRTAFKKGNLPHNTRYLGHERLSKEGYVEISVDETNPHTGYERSYVLKHRWLWERKNGQIPEGHVLKCLDGDKLNTDPSNWQAIPRSLLPRLNGGRHKRFPIFDSAPAEVKPAILAVARLDHAAREARKPDTLREGRGA